MNHERINPDKFGDESIERISTIKKQNFDPKVPNWIKLSALINKFGDESDYLQYG